MTPLNGFSAPAVPAHGTVAAQTATAATLVLEDLTRSFGSRRVLGPLNFRLDVGALAVIHGANGAGKTTLLRIAAGLLTPSSGTRTCPGRALYLRPGSGARHGLTAQQVVVHTAALTGTATGTALEACQLAGLTDSLLHHRVDELSTGQRTRLTMALALTAHPGLACLDEPTVHLDADGIGGIRDVLRQLTAQGTSVLLASHTPTQFRDLADATLLLSAGILQETPW